LGHGTVANTQPCQPGFIPSDAADLFHRVPQAAAQDELANGEFAA